MSCSRMLTHLSEESWFRVRLGGRLRRCPASVVLQVVPGQPTAYLCWTRRKQKKGGRREQTHTLSVAFFLLGLEETLELCEIRCGSEMQKNMEPSAS